jgi:carbamate kinase
MFIILTAVWKVIRSWLTEEQKEKIILVKKADMSKYIAKDQLEEHMVDGK